MLILTTLERQTRERDQHDESLQEQTDSHLKKTDKISRHYH